MNMASFEFQWSAVQSLSQKNKKLNKKQLHNLKNRHQVHSALPGPFSTKIAFIAGLLFWNALYFNVVFVVQFEVLGMQFNVEIKLMYMM